MYLDTSPWKTEGGMEICRKYGGYNTTILASKLTSNINEHSRFMIVKVILVEVCNACGYLLLGCKASRFDEIVGYPSLMVNSLLSLFLPRNNSIVCSSKKYMTLARYQEPANATKAFIAS